MNTDFKKMRYLRMVNGLTLQDMSDMVKKEFGVTVTAGCISHWESGMFKPKYNNMYIVDKMCSYLEKVYGDKYGEKFDVPDLGKTYVNLLGKHPIKRAIVPCSNDTEGETAKKTRGVSKIMEHKMKNSKVPRSLTQGTGSKKTKKVNVVYKLFGIPIITKEEVK